MSMPLDQHIGAAPAKKSGKSGCMIAAIVGGVLLVIGLVTVIGFSIWGYSKMKDNFAMEPAKVTSMADQIVKIDFSQLPSWKPMFAMDIFVMKMAMFADEEAGAYMFIADGDPAALGTDEAFESQMRAEISKQHAQQGRQKNMEATTEIGSSREEFMIRGEPRSFLVKTLEGVESKTRFYEISGSVDSNQSGRTAFLYLRAPESAVSLEQAKALFETAK